MYKLLFNYTGGHDFAQVLHQLYVYMYITEITVPFNSHTYKHIIDAILEQNHVRQCK